VLGIFLSPMARPLLPVDSFMAFQSALKLEPPSNEGHELAGLPQFYADMFGWEELAKNVSKVYRSLPIEERKHTVVYCNNYGKAGAIEYYSKKYSLPKVICPHNSYWYWSLDYIEHTRNNQISTVIIIGGNVEDHRQSLEQVEAAGVHKTKYAMPYENNLTIFIGKGLKRSSWQIIQSNKIFI
jgi:hypothetical protein